MVSPWGDTPRGAQITLSPPPGEPAERLGWTWKAVNAVLFLGVAVMLLSVGGQVFSRFLGVSITWTEELTRLVFQSMMFLGMAAGFRTAAHPRVALLVARGPAWVKSASAHVYALVGTAFFLVILVMAWELMIQQINSGESTPALGVDMYIVSIVLMVSCVLAILAHLQSVYYSKEMRRAIEDGDITS
ncbi:TRAP transporter small permease [Nesterenkonia sandarakina]|uniref:TRAP transporter small permease n=1 Tax=Nesterenkonia sandarakina TaxID=272918 RepID=UPI000D06B6ED|nr:TRAP transporter small permease subunit [Nesterenkonia sandarakina]